MPQSVSFACLEYLYLKFCYLFFIICKYNFFSWIIVGFNLNQWRISQLIANLNKCWQLTISSMVYIKGTREFIVARNKYLHWMIPKTLLGMCGRVCVNVQFSTIVSNSLNTLLITLLIHHLFFYYPIPVQCCSSYKN